VCGLVEYFCSIDTCDETKGGCCAGALGGNLDSCDGPVDLETIQYNLCSNPIVVYYGEITGDNCSGDNESYEGACACPTSPPYPCAGSSGYFFPHSPQCFWAHFVTIVGYGDYDDGIEDYDMIYIFDTEPCEGFYEIVYEGFPDSGFWWASFYTQSSDA
jgi:hypothetical protein